MKLWMTVLCIMCAQPAYAYRICDGFPTTCKEITIPPDAPPHVYAPVYAQPSTNGIEWQMPVRRQTTWCQFITRDQFVCQ